jgi:hypothetical protein
MMLDDDEWAEHLKMLRASKKAVEREVAATLSEPPVKGMKLIPMGMPLMFEAWAGCVGWAVDNQEIREAFRQQTGFKLENLIQRAPIDAMIDKATGYEQQVLAAFCDYVTEHIWGQQEKSESKNDVICG